MKRIIAVMLAVLAVLLTVGCASTGNTAETNDAKESARDTHSADAGTGDADSETEGATAGEVSEEPADVFGDDLKTICFRGGLTIALGANGGDVIPALGEPIDKIEAPSCVHDGNDVVYYYEGYNVTTQPDGNGNDVVTSVDVTSENAVLLNGITVGCTVADARAAFMIGDDVEETFGVITCELEKLTLDIVCDGDVVISLSFTYKAD